jgi:asparagine synthase (glutamine-hydrolysing)
MCGICGVVGFGNADLVRRMRDSLAHRGPDSAGDVFFTRENVGLGHRRLRIIDLSPDADQPMTQEDGTIWIVFNGEIYNFSELRQDLEKRGHRFKSRSDTEVILHLYEELGAACIARLNGIFAIAIYDRPRRKLILARDHLGVKPLYYHHAGARFIFGSELKALLVSGIYSRELNYQALWDYFTYLYVPCPDTLFQGIFQIPPAHLMELDLRTNERRLWQYWRADDEDVSGAQNDNHQTYEDSKAELRELLTDSVRRQMISDVPLGVFLSGGIDSPILTGLMAQFSPRKVKTFTIVFYGKGVEPYNEQQAARAVAEKFATEHHEIPVDISNPAEMLELVDHFDQPFGNPTFYLMYLISKHTRTEATVALCGAGGDELFAGYPRYRAVAATRWLRWLPGPVLAGMRGMAHMVRHNQRATRLHRVAQFLGGLDRDEARQFVNWVYFLDEPEKSLLMNAARANKLLASERVIRSCLLGRRLPDAGNRVLHVDVQTFLVDNILEYTDKMSMASALEVRVPYLDPRFVQRSLRIPFRHKLCGAVGKALLRDAFADLLPESNSHLPKKGFNAPLALWMRERLDTYFDRHMSRPAVENQGILNWDYLQRLRGDHRDGRRDNSYPLFGILMFDVWYRKYFAEAN